MTNHWPLLASTAMICSAAALGIWQQRNNESSAGPQTEIVRTTDSAPQALAAASPAVPAAANATPPDASVSARPAEMPPGPAPEAPPMMPAPVPAANPVAVTPTSRGMGMDFTAGKGTRDQAFLELRAALQAKVSGTTLELPGGGYAFVPVGARMEVLPQLGADWRISLYNINGRTPDIESDSFKSCLAAIVTALAIDMTPKPLDRGDNKTSLKTSSRLGRIVMDRDPNNANSCIITPTFQQPRKTAGQAVLPMNNVPPANVVAPANVVPPANAPAPPAPKNVGDPTF